MEIARERLQAKCMAVSAEGARSARPAAEATVDRAALVSEALTELAVLRGQLDGRKFG
jgi:hypothetical protein